MFYQAVVQVVLLFGSETWVLLSAMSRKLEGVHMGFLRQVMGKKYKQQRDGTCRSAAAAKALKEAGNKTLEAYIDKWQATVAEWLELIPILDN